MPIVNRDSFVPEREEGDSIHGSVEVTLRGQTKRVRAIHTPKYGWIHAYDIVGRYHTGNKQWPAHILSKSDGNEHVNFGRDDRDRKFKKENNIWFK